MMPPLAIIRADASKRVGGGHVMRCLTLGLELTKKGWLCAFAVRHHTIETVPVLLNSGIEVFLLQGPENEEGLELRNRWPGGCKLLIVDHYYRDKAFESSCRGWAERIMVVDDLANRYHDCDILLDQTPGHREKDYLDFVPAQCQFLLGPRFALLRPDFAELRIQALNRREKIGPVETIFISFGMMDNRNGCLASLISLKQSGFKGQVHVMIGAVAPYLSELENLIPKWPFTVRLHVDEKAPAALMAEADIAIGAGGSTTWERCCLGLPSVVWVAAENQQKVAEDLAQEGALFSVQGSIESQVGAIAELISSLISDNALRLGMSRKAAMICDGYGALRCLLAVCPEEQTTDGRKIKIRPGLDSDTDLIFGWQSDPQTRLFFRNPRTPTHDEHLRWMQHTLCSPDRHLFLVECNNLPVGVLRLDKCADPSTYEVSIFISNSYQGLGIGKAALRFAQKAMVGWSFRAEVHPDNIASRILFSSAGYREEQENIFIFSGTSSTTDVKRNAISN